MYKAPQGGQGSLQCIEYLKEVIYTLKYSRTFMFRVPIFYSLLSFLRRRPLGGLLNAD